MIIRKAATDIGLSMRLKRRYQEAYVVYDSLQAALCVFKDLSIFSNWATTIQVPLTIGHITMVHYEGMYSPNSPGISVFLDEGEQTPVEYLEFIMEHVFAPFILDGIIHRSYVVVEEIDPSVVGSFGPSYTIFVHLVFAGHKASDDIIHEEFKSGADNYKKTHSMTYFLD